MLTGSFRTRILSRYLFMVVGRPDRCVRFGTDHGVAKRRAVGRTRLGICPAVSGTADWARPIDESSVWTAIKGRVDRRMQPLRIKSFLRRML